MADVERRSLRPASQLAAQIQSLSSPSLGVPDLYFVRLTVPAPKVVDRWNEKRAMFGVYDNIGILGKTRLRCTEFENGSYAITIFFSPV